MHVKFIPAICAALLSAAGCASDRGGTAEDIAKPAGLTRAMVRTDQFIIAAYLRVSDPTAPVVVYIEGDGLAFVSGGRITPDPTPRRALGLQLAALDPSPNIIYLARPCQYTMDIDGRCSNSDFWTIRRFAEDVVASMNQAMDRLKPPNARGVRLVGYSGGGAVAALIAARRSDVMDLRTVAGNLDHVLVNQIHNVLQLTGSLNAADVAARLTGLPQLHLVGGRDTIVPAQVAESYASRAGDRRCVTIRRIDGAGHEDGWTEAWPAALRQPLTCGGA